LQPDADGGLAGSVTRAGTRYAVRGRVESGVGKGLFHDAWSGTFFEARRQGDTLEFVILESAPDAADYLRRPHVLARRVAAAGPAGGRPGRLAVHPAGFEVWVPEGWTPEPTGGNLRLRPPEASPQGLVVLVMAADLGRPPPEGHRPDDPRVLHLLNTLATTLSESLRRTGAGAAVESGPFRGALLEWTADAVDPAARRGRAWVTILGSRAAALMASGPGAPLAALEGDLRLVFLSFGFDGSVPAPALMRSWDYRAALRFGPGGWGTDWSGERAPADRPCSLALAPEGTWIRTRPEGEERGRWDSGNGILRLHRDEGVEVYEYAVEPEAEGIVLRLRAGDRGEIWLRR
ncbi:MAG: hypothetical protein FJ098_15580, partial [Deltaproteobacteria bacterium]|nr:hypothetical protein [Deltaproteobacteria bacterium]